jgi:Bacterial HORMA domain 2
VSTSVGTSTAVHTRTQTATHLSDAILGSFSSILARLGLSDSYLSRNWGTIESGLMTWIEEGSLDEVRLEIGSPSNPDAVFEVPIEYRYSGEGDIEFVTSQARLARAMAKLGAVPAGAEYRVVVTYRCQHANVSGWSETTAADTSGLSAYRFGSLAAGPDASASMTYFSKGS